MKKFLLLLPVFLSIIEVNAQRLYTYFDHKNALFAFDDGVFREIEYRPINDMKGVFDDPQVQHLKLAASIESGDNRGTVNVISQPVSLSRTPSRLAAPPPERGQHTDAILKEHGFTKSEIASLRKSGVI